MMLDVFDAEWEEKLRGRVVWAAENAAKEAANHVLTFAPGRLADGVDVDDVYRSPGVVAGAYDIAGMVGMSGLWMILDDVREEAKRRLFETYRDVFEEAWRLAIVGDFRSRMSVG